MSSRPKPSASVPHHLVDEDGQSVADRPWIFRTYAGHTSPRASNELFRANLAKGQTGLSIAFDLPTQCGYSSDHPLAGPEVGKVGVPINSLDDMAVLFDGIPLEEMNTSMTINGTAMWLLALYIALAEERGIDIQELRGTTQNDIVKEYLSRGTYIYPPAPSLRLIAETYEYCLQHLPKWNPSNVCSYHLQEAGATPAQELAFALATAIGVLDQIKDRAVVPTQDFGRCVARISFFVNSGIRFVEEMCKMRAFVELWDGITKERYSVVDAKQRRFRYGVQVNSLGLTETQPENNAWRILLEALAVTLSRDARCRALQLPAWNEALSLPTPWDQQWSLRAQQILALETDLLEYPDLFEGSVVVTSRVGELVAEAQAELAKIEELGGVGPALESGYLKRSLVESMTRRMGRISTGEQVVVGVNCYQDGVPSPLAGNSALFQPDHGAAEEALGSLRKTLAARDGEKANAALAALETAAADGANLLPPSIECALARVTTGEWADTLRRVFGDYRAATGIEGQSVDLDEERLAELRGRADSFKASRGRRPKVVIGKPGLDGHSNGAEMVAVAARSAGLDVVYGGIRSTPAAIAQAAIDEDADLIGVSILSGSHLALVEQLMTALEAAGATTPVVVGGIIPNDDARLLRERGVRTVFTPADFRLIDVVEALMTEIDGDG